MLPDMSLECKPRPILHVGIRQIQCMSPVLQRQLLAYEQDCGDGIQPCQLRQQQHQRCAPRPGHCSKCLHA